MNVIAPLRHVFSRSAISGRLPAEFRRRYRRLYEAPLEKQPDGGACFDRGRLWRRGGVNVLRLAGDSFEMAFQHGRLLEAEIAHGTLQQTSLLVRDAIRNSVGGHCVPWLANLYVQRCIAASIARSSLAYLGTPASKALPELYGISESTGIPVRTIVRAVLGPETAQVLLGMTEAKVGGGGPHCSSFAAWGSVTQGGELLIGRNTDYPLNGYFDVTPTVIYFEPSDGTQRYMTVTSAGSHIPGVCGMNEHGLFVCVHTVPSNSVSEEGIAVFLLGQEVLRRAHTLDDAVGILREARPAGWNYHVISARERRAITFELCCAATAVRRCEGEASITTNHWSQPEMMPHLMTSIATFMEDSQGRAARVQAMIDAARGRLDAPAAAAILGDSTDPASGRHRCFPGAIAATHTVSSSIWRPDAQTVYVGARGAPTSRGHFVALPTCESLDPDELSRAPVEFLESALPADPPGLAEARQLVIAARIAFEYHSDAATAAEMLACACSQFDDPALDLSAALMEIRAGRYQAAGSSVARAIDQDWDPHRAAVAHYLRGRLFADRGDPDAARADFQAVQESGLGDQRLIAAARSAERMLGARRRLRLRPIEVVPMGWLPDAFRYLGRM